MHIASHRIRTMQQWNFFIWDRYIYFLLRTPPPPCRGHHSSAENVNVGVSANGGPANFRPPRSDGNIYNMTYPAHGQSFPNDSGTKTMKPVYSKFQKTQKSVNKRDKKRKKIPSLKFSPLFLSIGILFNQKSCSAFSWKKLIHLSTGRLDWQVQFHFIIYSYVSNCEEFYIFNSFGKFLQKHCLNLYFKYKFLMW